MHRYVPAFLCVHLAYTLQAGARASWHWMRRSAPLFPTARWPASPSTVPALPTSAWPSAAKSPTGTPTTPLPIPAGLILTGLPRWHARLVGRSVLALLLMLARCVCLLRTRWVDSRLAQGGSAAEHAVCGSDVARPAWNGGHRRRCGGPLPYKLCTAVLSYPTRMTRTGHGAD